LVDALADRGLYLFDIWGYCPQGVEEAREWSEYRVPEEMHRYLLERLGALYLGWDNGEQDGRYVGGFARRLCPAPSSRAEAYRAFRAYMDRLADDLQHHLVALNSLTLTHYLAERPDHRLLGLETAQGLPSVPMWFAFLRGACKQYGLPWFGNASIWNRWGVNRPDAPDDRREGSQWSGPNSGTSLDLLRQLWYLEVMYGSCIMSFEGGHLSATRTTAATVDGKEQQVPALTPIGEMQLEGTRWCEAHPHRGVQHTPLALLWEHDAGWLPPRHLYTPDTFLVWGNVPYTAGDHQIDLVLRELFPGYENGSFYHDETGFVTPTPCGDIADVLLSDVHAAVLDRYRCVVVLGETRLGGDLLSRLARFAARGGMVVAFANQCPPEALAFFGVEDAGVDLHLHHAFVGGSPSSWREPPYAARALRVVDGEVLARTGPTDEAGPLAVRRRLTGGGETLLFEAAHGLSLPQGSPEDIRSREDQPLGSPHRLLEHVRALLLPALRAFNLVDVVGGPISGGAASRGSPRRAVVAPRGRGRCPDLGGVGLGGCAPAGGRGGRIGRRPPDHAVPGRGGGPPVTEVRGPGTDPAVLALDPVMLTGDDDPGVVAEAKGRGFTDLVLPPRAIDGPRAGAWGASLDRAGCRVLAVNAVTELTPYLDGSLSDSVPRRREQVVRRLVSLLQPMAAMGARWLVVAPGRVAENYQSPDEARGTYVRSLRELANACPTGVCVLAEAMPLRLTAHAADLWTVLQEAAHPRLGAALDMGHTLLGGDRPAGATALLRDALRLLLVDDADLTPGRARLDRHLPPGRGALAPADVAYLADLPVRWVLNVRAPAGEDPWSLAEAARDWWVEAYTGRDGLGGDR